MPNQVGEIDPSDEAGAEQVQNMIGDLVQSNNIGLIGKSRRGKGAHLHIWYYMGGVSFGNIKGIVISTLEILEPP